jgi:hypothetical protein
MDVTLDRRANQLLILIGSQAERWILRNAVDSAQAGGSRGATADSIGVEEITASFEEFLQHGLDEWRTVILDAASGANQNDVAQARRAGEQGSPTRSLLS